jgi:hypothetical protein
MWDDSFLIQVVKARPRSKISKGQTSAPISRRALIGRGELADFRLDDPTVSSRHVELSTTDDGFEVGVLSSRGTTFLNQEELKPGEHRKIKGRSAWLQLGDVLLKVSVAPTTIPATEGPLSIPDRSDIEVTPAFLRVCAGRYPGTWVKGERLNLYPSSQRALERLCEHPSSVFDYYALQAAIAPDDAGRAGGMNLSQVMTYIRDAFAQALDCGYCSDQELCALVMSTRLASGDPRHHVPSDRRQLLRALVENLRGVGYRLCLPPSAVSFEQR